MPGRLLHALHFGIRAVGFCARHARQRTGPKSLARDHSAAPETACLAPKIIEKGSANGSPSTGKQVPALGLWALVTPGVSVNLNQQGSLQGSSTPEFAPDVRFAEVRGWELGVGALGSPHVGGG
jgi:hypothetical protein